MVLSVRPRLFLFAVGFGLATLVGACGASTPLDDFSDGAPPPDAGFDAAFDVGSGQVLLGASGEISSESPLWGRPFFCSDPASGDEYHYEVVRFDNPLRAAIRVSIEVDWLGVDGFLHVYRNFSPDRPANSCIDANDDDGGTDRSRVSGISVPPRSGIDIVLSTYGQRTTGRYSAFVISE